MCKPVFKNYVMAGYPLLWVETHEEHRALTSFAKELESSSGRVKLYTWDRVDAIKEIGIKNNVLASAPVKLEGIEDCDALTALMWAETKMADDSILFLKDFHHYCKKDTVSRKIRNLLPAFKANGKCLVILSHTVDIPPEIEKEITVVPFKLPDIEGLRTVLHGICESTEAPYPKEDDPVLVAALGMTAFEAENAFAVSLIEKKGFDQDIVRREKASVVRKTGLLEVVETSQTLADVGGLENLKGWLGGRAGCFTVKARDYGLIPPKGILLVGVPGCGKSLVSKAVATAWHRPLLRMDMGKMMGSYVGESEGNTRRSLAIAEAVAPCVLWIDELEKSFSGVGGHESDGHGTTKRVFSTFLTWMQEKTADVFLVATANNVQSLPPEMLRRFDVTFWVDLPNEKQREEILAIHIAKVKRDPKKYDTKALAKMSNGLTGSEIEVWVKETLTRAFQHGGEPTDKDFADAFGEITPISRLMAADIQRSRDWAENRGVKYASAKEDAPDLEAAPKARKISR